MLVKQVENYPREYLSIAINNSDKNQSVITDYRLSFNHEFDWENVQILDKERFLNKRLNSEMLHICMQKNGLNLKIEYLHYSYASFPDSTVTF